MEAEISKELCKSCINEEMAEKAVGLCKYCQVNAPLRHQKRPENYCTDCYGSGKRPHEDGSFKEWCESCDGTGVKKEKSGTEKTELVTWICSACVKRQTTLSSDKLVCKRCGWWSTREKNGEWGPQSPPVKKKKE